MEMLDIFLISCIKFRHTWRNNIYDIIGQDNAPKMRTSPDLYPIGDIFMELKISNPVVYDYIISGFKNSIAENNTPDYAQLCLECELNKAICKGCTPDEVHAMTLFKHLFKHLLLDSSDDEIWMVCQNQAIDRKEIYLCLNKYCIP